MPHFAKPEALPSALADAFHGVHVPIHPNEHIAASLPATQTSAKP